MTPDLEAFLDRLRSRIAVKRRTLEMMADSGLRCGKREWPDGSWVDTTEETRAAFQEEIETDERLIELTERDYKIDPQNGR